MIRLLFTALILLVSVQIATSAEVKPVFEFLDASFKKLIPANSKIEKLAGGFQFTEGPVWMRDGYLVFSDIPANRIIKWTVDGKVSEFRNPSNNSNGLTLDSAGNLVACEHGSRTVTLTRREGKPEVIASTYDGMLLNSPNDAVFHKDGTLYFTDPTYGIEQAKSETGFRGVYRLDVKTGRIQLLTKDMDMPNGLAFSPDFRKLYINDSSSRMHMMIFDVQADGSLANGQVFAEMKTGKPGAPDGIKIDRLGNIWTTGPGGVWIFNPAGKQIGMINFPETTANCAWGGTDGKDFFVTASTGLYRIRTIVGGMLP